MSIERHEYSEINDLLKSLRRSRLLNSRGIIQRTFKVHHSSITIQEESERSLRSSVSEIDECLSFFLGTDEMKTIFKEKNVLDIDAGCGLIGIITAQLGAHVVFANSADLMPILKSNLANNCPESGHEIKEFDWGKDASELCNHFNDFVLCGSHILQNREEGAIEAILKNLVDVSGNGTTLILGYKVPQHEPEIETQFREVLCKSFDLRNGRQVIYEMPDGDVVIMFVRRKPFSSFFDNPTVMASLQAHHLTRVAAVQASMAAAMEFEPSIADVSADDDADELEDAVVRIESLHALGVPNADIGKLKSAGIVTVAGAMMTSKKRMMEIKGLTLPRIDRIVSACEQMTTTTFISAVNLLQKRKSIFKISTGSSALDAILDGGIESTTITEVFGESRTGKTQLMHTLCVTAQLPHENQGGNGMVAYIDTENSFRPERIGPITRRFGIEFGKTAENIVCARAFSHEQQDSLITAAAALMVEGQFSLLIIDSFTSLFRVEFLGREELAPRQQAIASMMNKLTKIASEFNVAVLITNQVMADPTASSLSNETRKPVGGHVVAHASTTRLSLRKGLGEKRICKIYDSPCLPESEAVFCIANGGIIDAPDA